ncbi:MAG: hypothetical protein AAGH48_04605 [Pseudomonadota bacterium]
MKYLAIVLASVASLAATAQAYLLWSAQEEKVDRRAQLERNRMCRNIVRASSGLTKLFDSKEVYLEYMLNEEATTWTLKPPSDEDDRSPTDAELLEKRRKRAQQTFSVDVFRALEPVENYYLFGPVYFNKEELDILEYETVTDLFKALKSKTAFWWVGALEVDLEQIEADARTFAGAASPCMLELRRQRG